jgi:hypothetical protein
MLRGVLPENEQRARELLNDSQSFLKELVDYYKGQIEILMGRAQAETQYISAYVDKIGLLNLEHSLLRLQQLSSDNDPRLAQKCLQYLQRTEEFLTKISQNSHDGAIFIPVPFHKAVAAEHAAQLTSCKALVCRANEAVAPAPDQSKSWFSRFLNFANILPDIRAAAWALPKGNKEEASDRLQTIHNNLLALDGKKDGDAIVTKTTRKALQIEGFNAEPGAKSDYHELVPPLESVMVSFKSFIAKQKESNAAMTKEAVLAAVETPFPRPVM